MCFVFTCGETEFSSYLQGYENVTCQCHNCGNFSAHVMKKRPFFTFCFVPVIPLSLHGYEDVICSICNFAQPLQNRQDVLSQHGGGGYQLQPQGQGPPQHGQGGSSQQGWGAGPPPGQKMNQGMQYG